ncbi:hypothetical protein [Candidatus Viadribacter manganicus]|uniref:Uncharacterized protein n=1 Tax=Candidatus Viadribacter manganicus TaxID=1759059 RepID=A0A1B1AG42_9PROT|nr:hypothetical protein [Candidatus Viadribacter manganicus]ANP45529.1 hypothetical protein ATE48_06150 [Candidatus Viadribacter manganicus]
MKLTQTASVITLLLFTVATPGLAQQAQQPTDEQTERAQPNTSRTSRNYTGGRFAADIAGQPPGFLNPVGGKDQTPTVQDPNAASAAAPRPVIVTRPGAVVIAPAADDKDDD